MKYRTYAYIITLGFNIWTGRYMKLKDTQRIKKLLIEGGYYIVLSILILLVMNKVICLFQRNLNFPFIYDGGDAAVTFYRSFEMKTDHSLFGFNQLGTPYGSNTYDFYVFDIGLYIIQFFFALISPNYVFGFNLFLIAGAWFNGISSMYSLRRLKFAAPLSVMLSVVYASLPFFYMRYHNHTYLAYYFAAPIAICIAIELYRNEFVFSFKKETRTQTIINTVLLVVIGTTGIYWAVFSCIYFLLVAILRGMEDMKFKSALNSIKAIGLTFGGFVIAVIPPVIYWIRNGVGYLFTMRTGFLWAGEVYSVKLAELVLPNVSHRLSKLRTLRKSYTDAFGVNESMTAALGLLFSIGLLISLIYIFKIANSDKKHIMRPVSLLSVASILIVTNGGLGTFFAAIFPFVRCYNRMSVFIAFLCAVSVGWALTELYEIAKKKIKKPLILKGIALIFLGCLMVCAVYDETFPAGNSQPYHQALYEEDRNLIWQIVDYEHDHDPKDEMVDVMFFPYMDFPENYRNTGGVLSGYEPMNLCSHSEDFAVSFGSQRGREYSDELVELEKLSMDERLDWAIENGFDGVMISYEGMKKTSKKDLYAIAERYGDPDCYNVRYMYWSFDT